MHHYSLFAQPDRQSLADQNVRWVKVGDAYGCSFGDLIDDDLGIIPLISAGYGQTGSGAKDLAGLGSNLEIEIGIFRIFWATASEQKNH